MTAARHVSATVSVPQKVRYRDRYIERVDIQGQALPILLPSTFEVERGRLFSPLELQRSRQVVVLGSEVAEKLFEATNPLGKKIRIADLPFSVVGIAAEQGSVPDQIGQAFAKGPGLARWHAPGGCRVAHRSCGFGESGLWRVWTLGIWWIPRTVPAAPRVSNLPQFSGIGRPGS